MIVDVIILAAGVGSRLRPLTDYIPKTMVKVSGKTIIERLFDQLTCNKDVSINVLAGYKHKILKEFLDSKGYKFNFIVNEHFDKTNNMFSLSLGLDEIISTNNNLIVINADCVYDDEIVKQMLISNKSCIAIDDTVFNDESMKVILDEKGNVIEMSKQIKKAENSFVSMDIYNFSNESKQNLNIIVKDFLQKGDINSWTEVAINLLVKNNEVIKSMPFKNKWMEIDDLKDLEIAEELFI
jgi:choline kinase